MKTLGVLSVCLLVVMVSSSRAAEIRFGHGSPEGVVYDTSTGYVGIPWEVENNDLGTEYAYATVYSSRGATNRPSSGLLGLFHFGSNSNRWASLDAMVNGHTGGKRNVSTSLTGGGYLSAGWKINTLPDGSLRIEPEYPGHNLEEDWVDNTHDGNHAAKGYLAIGSWLYDGDGDTNNFSLTDVAPGDAIPYISTNLMDSGAIAVTTAGTRLPTPGRFLDLRVSPVITAELHTAVEIRWNSQPGRVYQVEWTDAIESNSWHDLDEAVTATGETMRAFDSIHMTNRFYRVTSRSRSR
jgi:hypothetical protein